MKRRKNSSARGRRTEKEFTLFLEKTFPSAQTEFKPRVINLTKDFWRFFDGLTFVATKKKYIFWQVKSNSVSAKARAEFFKSAKIFGNSHIKVLFVQKNKDKIFEIFIEATKVAPIKKIFQADDF